MGPIVFCLLIIALCIQVVSSCDNGWTTYDGHCYYFADKKVNWTTASTICKSYNAHLAIVDNEHEENFLRQVAKRYASGHNDDILYWLDGSDSVHEGHWIWTESGQSLSYTDWFPGEPNHIHSDSDCLVLHSRMEFRWDDEPCRHTARYICEVGGHWISFG